MRGVLGRVELCRELQGAVAALCIIWRTLQCSAPYLQSSTCCKLLRCTHPVPAQAVYPAGNTYTVCATSRWQLLRLCLLPDAHQHVSLSIQCAFLTVLLCLCVLLVRYLMVCIGVHHLAALVLFVVNTFFRPPPLKSADYLPLQQHPLPANSKPQHKTSGHGGQQDTKTSDDKSEASQFVEPGLLARAASCFASIVCDIKGAFLEDQHFRCVL